MAIIIRKGMPKDFPVLMGLIKELAVFENSLDEVKNSVAQMRKEKKLFRSFIAQEGGKVVGAAIYFFAYYTWVGKSLYLDDLYIRPKFRGRQVGTMLLKRIFKVAKEEKCRRVRWQVLDWNEKAIDFYKKHGANISDEWLNCDFDANGIDQFLKKN